MLIGLIGSIGSGIAMPIMALLTGGAIGTFAETSADNMEGMGYNEKMELYANFKHDANITVNQFLYIGIAVFVVEYSCLRQMHHLKEKYFARILEQEQGWFDQHNAFEFATKVQVQLDQIELGVGEKFGQVIEMVSQFIAGLVIAFTTS